MNHSLDGKSEDIKNSTKNAVEKSKETIKELVVSKTKLIGNALETNKKMLNSVKKKTTEKRLRNTVTETLKSTFDISVELTEEALGSIINSYSTQMELNLDFNTKLVGILKKSSVDHPGKVLELIKSNLEASQELIKVSTKKMFDVYKIHTNLALNFNQQFGDSINSQIETISNLQSKGLNKFTHWASAWGKQADKY